MSATNSADDDRFRHGAVLLRCALQVNPYQYLVKNKKPLGGLDEDGYNAAIVQGCLDNAIDLIAVTDHYSVTESIALIEAAEAAGIYAFPGFEAAAADGVHYLCIFERGTPVKELERCIGACGVKSEDHEGGIGNVDSHALLRLAAEWACVIVAAHATDSKGLLGHLQGKPHEKVWKNDQLIAVAISTPIASLDGGNAGILQGRVAEYQRPYPPAVLYAADVMSVSDLAKPAATTFLRMSEPSIDGLRHAFLDPESRLRLPDAPVEAHHPHLRSITWDGGFLDGQTVRLNPSLNVVVGPRGAGKSTVLESVRYVLGLKPMGLAAKQAYEGFVTEVLGDGTKVAIEVFDPARPAQILRIERGVPGESRVVGSDGEDTGLTPGDVLGEVEFFGQHEVAELARLPHARSRLLTRFQLSSPPPKRDRKAVANVLAENRKQVLLAIADAERLTLRVERLPGVKTQLETYDKAGVKKRLDLEARYEQEEPLLTETDELLDACEDEREKLLPFGVEFLADDVIQDLPSKAEFEELRLALAAVATAWQNTGRALAKVTEEGRQALARVRAKRAQRRAEVNDAFLERLRELKAEQIDGKRFLRLERERVELEADAKKLITATKLVRDLRRTRSALLKEWAALKEADHNTLQVAADQVTKELRRTVRVSCTYHGNRTPLLEFLRDETKGQLHLVANVVEQDAKFGPADLAAACRKGRDDLQQLLDLDGKQVDKLLELSEDTLLRMEELWLDSTTIIELRVGAKLSGEPIWRALEHLSTGEKATAILLVLLLASSQSAPLIIDQAEDDLDNSFIADDIVPRLRAEKSLRQFILSTHNPNIPVLGDAEQVVRLTPEGEAGAGGRAVVEPSQVGSLDRQDVRRVLEALEGGREAFELRRRRYGY